MSNNIDQEEFGVIVSTKKIDDRLELLHMEFAVEKPPEYNQWNMAGIWRQNQDLRVKILLCQKEYIQENEKKNEYHRKYIDMFRISNYMKEKHEHQVKYLNNEIDEARREIADLFGKLKSANEFIDQLIKESGKENEQ